MPVNVNTFYENSHIFHKKTLISLYERFFRLCMYSFSYDWNKKLLVLIFYDCFSFATLTNALNNGAGRFGLDLNSG